MKKLKFAIIGTIQSPNALDLKEEIVSRGHEVELLKFSDLVFEFDDKNQDFGVKDSRGDLLEKDIFIFRGYNKSFIEAQVLAEWLMENNKTVVDEFLAKKFVPSKMFEAMRLSQKKVKHLKSYQSIGNDSLKKPLSSMNYPIIIKPINAQKGQGVIMVNEYEEALDFFEKNPRGFMAQEYVKIDGDIRVLVIAGKVIGAIKRLVGKGDFRSNVSIGSKAEKIEMSTELERISLDAVEAMGYETAGVDVIEKDGEYRVLEVNFAPEWQGFKKITGIKPAKYIIDYAIGKYEKN